MRSTSKLPINIDDFLQMRSQSPDTQRMRENILDAVSELEQHREASAVVSAPIKAGILAGLTRPSFNHRLSGAICSATGVMLLGIYLLAAAPPNSRLELPATLLLSEPIDSAEIEFQDSILLNSELLFD